MKALCTSKLHEVVNVWVKLMFAIHDVSKAHVVETDKVRSAKYATDPTVCRISKSQENVKDKEGRILKVDCVSRFQVSVKD